MYMYGWGVVGTVGQAGQLLKFLVPGSDSEVEP